MDFIVSPAVLIPRPETEHVVETVLQLAGSALANENPQNLQNHRGAPRESGSNLRIVDVGTGSGCIALALAKELPSAEIHATDISTEAIEIARANAARHQLQTRVQFHQADLLQGPELRTFDFVISNPPYVGESEEDQVQLEVRKFEPKQAVFAGPTGLEVIARLVPQAQAALRPEGWLVMEISGTIAAAVRGILDGWSEVRIINDLQGIARVAAARKVARKPENST
jgi:release factor glutamine methyltransferase